jgi:hypothetical protein
VPVAIDAFIGLSIEDILEIESAAVAAVKAGGSVVSWSSEGSSVTKNVDGTPTDTLRAVLFAKRFIQPEIYGRNITRTSVSFVRPGEITEV